MATDKQEDALGEYVSALGWLKTAGDWLDEAEDAFKRSTDTRVAALVALAQTFPCPERPCLAKVGQNCRWGTPNVEMVHNSRERLARDFLIQRGVKDL